MPVPAIEIDEGVETFHHRPFDDVTAPAVWLPRLTPQATLVLGSSQQPDTIDHQVRREHSISLATRRTGGGAVLVSANDLVWIDVVLPSSHELWTTDVSRSFDWLGDAIQHGLHALEIPTERHRGPLLKNEWSARICFASLGPGELTIGGRKLVGISQRRTRTAARFQIAILRRWDPTLHASLLATDEASRRRAEIDLATAATAIPHRPETIVASILPELEKRLGSSFTEPGGVP